MALERARLLEEAQLRARRESTIRKITDKVNVSFDLETILRTAAEDLSTALGASGAYIELGLHEKTDDISSIQIDSPGSSTPDNGKGEK